MNNRGKIVDKRLRPVRRGWRKAIEASHYMPVCLANSEIIVTLEWTSY